MTNNNIRSKLVEIGMAQAQLARMLPDDVGSDGVELLLTGSVLPTRQSLFTLCSILDCTPSDLYDLDDIRLDKVMNRPNEDEQRVTSGQHDGMQQMRVWLRPNEKQAIESAVSQLGYRSVAEWLREMIRNTIARNKRLHGRVTVTAD